MVEKKVAKELNKSAEIRKVATSMKEKGEKPRPVAIIAVLKKQGVEVSSPQVSMVLKRMGFRPRRAARQPPLDPPRQPRPACGRRSRGRFPWRT